MQTKPLPSQSRLLELFEYKNNNLYWKKKCSNKSSRAVIGKLAGSITGRGYRTIMVDSISYSAHRLIWVYHYGNNLDKKFIDHKDRIKTNNSITNLRIATSQGNNFNRSNVKGYTKVKRNLEKKWVSRIRINGKLLHIGYYKTELEAKNAYLEAKNNYLTKQGDTF